MGMRIIGRKQGDLDDWDIQRIIFWAKKDLEGKPDPVVESPRDGSGGDAV